MAKDIGFPRVLKKEQREIPRSIKKAEFPGVFKKKSHNFAKFPVGVDGDGGFRKVYLHSTVFAFFLE